LNTAITDIIMTQQKQGMKFLIMTAPTQKNELQRDFHKPT
jgi:hypothetical protein